jgi:hypothetical protein
LPSVYVISLSSHAIPRTRTSHLLDVEGGPEAYDLCTADDCIDLPVIRKSTTVPVWLVGSRWVGWRASYSQKAACGGPASGSVSSTGLTTGQDSANGVIAMYQALVRQSRSGTQQGRLWHASIHEHCYYIEYHEPHCHAVLPTAHQDSLENG